MKKMRSIKRQRLVEHPGIVAGFQERLKAIMSERNLKPRPLGEAAGLGETAVRDLFKAKKAPRIDTVYKIAEQLGLTLAELVEGDRPATRRVPIIGCAAAGEGWSYFEGDGPIDEITLDIDIGEAVGIDVKGDSMKPVYRDGDILIGTKWLGVDARRLIGLDCIIETTDRRRFVKFVAKGTLRDRYNLRSYSPDHGDIPNVNIAWAAPITIVVRNQR